MNVDLSTITETKRVLEYHIEDIDNEMNRRVDGDVRAELLKAKSMALQAAAMLHK